MVGTKIRHRTLFPAPTHYTFVMGKDVVLLHPAVSEFSTDTAIEGPKWWLTRQSSLPSLPRLICHRESYPITLWLWGSVLGLQIHSAPIATLLHVTGLVRGQPTVHRTHPTDLWGGSAFLWPVSINYSSVSDNMSRERGGSSRITGSSPLEGTSYRDWKLAPGKISWTPERSATAT